MLKPSCKKRTFLPLFHASMGSNGYGTMHRYAITAESIRSRIAKTHIGNNWHAIFLKPVPYRSTPICIPLLHDQWHITI